MSEHLVEFSVPKRPLERADIEFVVKTLNAETNKWHLLGTLKISKGSLEWFRGKTPKNGEKVNWEEFDGQMWEHSRKREAR